jgi:hypothetical protein
MKITSKYFTYEELTHTNTGLLNVPNSEQLKNLQELVTNVLDPLREMYGKPIKVNSGFRSTLVNNDRRVRGAKNSDHLKGMAVDLDCDSNSLLYKLIRDNFKFKQLINEHNFSLVHVSYDHDNLKCQQLTIK